MVVMLSTAMLRSINTKLYNLQVRPSKNNVQDCIYWANSREDNFHGVTWQPDPELHNHVAASVSSHIRVYHSLTSEPTSHVHMHKSGRCTPASDSNRCVPLVSVDITLT